MRGKILILSLLLILSSFLSACGNKNQLPLSVKQEVKPGGELVYGSQYEPNTLNPLLSDFIATHELGRLIFSGLVMTDDKGQWMPDLASEVPTLENGGVSADGKTVTYKLRRNITWHDGTPFTSEDVKFTYQLIASRRVQTVSQEGYKQIASVSTPDAYTVVVSFKQLYAPYLTLFPIILPKHILGNIQDINNAGFNRAPIGTGPFKFKEWRIGDSIILEANTSYYLGKPNLNSIVFKIIPDPNTIITQIKAGQIHIAGGIPLTQLEQVKSLANAKSYITPNTIWEHLDFNLDRELFKDERIRKAIMLAIDRQAIVDTTLKHAAVPAATDQPPVSWALNAQLKPYTRDVKTARALLEQAGYKNGPDGYYVKNGQKLTFTIATTKDNKTREAVAQNIVQQLKEVGILVEIRLVDAPVFFGETLKYRNFDTALYSWVSGADPDNSMLWNSKFIPSASNGYSGNNYSGLRNAEVDKLTQEAIMTVDLEKRKNLYYRLQELLAEICPVVPLYYRANIDVAANNVANFKPNPTLSGNLWNAWQWGFTK